MNDGVVRIHGKQYKTVALRVSEFRENFKDHALITELVSKDGSIITMKASVLNDKDRVIGTGYAEEDRSNGMINKTSALENCETSAIGRALASIGLAGEEYASANEVQNAIHQQSKESEKEVKWFNDFDKQRDRMIAKIKSGEQTNQGILGSLKKSGYAISKADQEKILNLKAI